MAGFLKFLGDYYWIFLGISIVLILSLIGYFVDRYRKKKNPYFHEKEEINLNINQKEDNSSVVMSDVGVVNTPVMGGSSTVEALFEGQNDK